jgi:plasmid maintenance system antidote protein VapI
MAKRGRNTFFRQVIGVLEDGQEHSLQGIAAVLTEQGRIPPEKAVHVFRTAAKNARYGNLDKPLEEQVWSGARRIVLSSLDHAVHNPLIRVRRIRRGWFQMDVDIPQPTGRAPGLVLRQELRTRGLTAEDLYDVTGVGRQTTQRMLRGERRIDEQMALAAEELTGITRTFWMLLEEVYDGTAKKVS